uniref:Uncharacterized protein n=1 Tax=Arion vulgaris TaxID=1028688 RepID=A0A0B7AD49_9EUPU
MLSVPNLDINIRRCEKIVKNLRSVVINKEQTRLSMKTSIKSGWNINASSRNYKFNVWAT